MSDKELRLPGSVAEVKASPHGPTVGAFFDLDGTLVAGFTAVILTRERFRKRDMGVGELISMVAAGLTHQFGRMEFESLIDKATEMLTGRPLSDLQQIGDRLFMEKIEKRIYPEMRELVQAHLEMGHTVVLSSSALTIQVEPVARFLGIANTLTNKFEVDFDGLLTGKVIRPIVWGPGKAAAVQKFAAENNVDLQQSYFYADGDEDVALMHLVGNPRPTNPGDKMADIARKRGWPILEFRSRGSGGVMGQVRTLLGVGSIIPAASGAVGWGLLTRSKRRGVSFFTSAFPQMLLAANGVRTRVIGEENLTKQRPAVFIFNHRNNFDPVLVGSLVKDNWTGVGKKELKNDPVLGTLGKLVDTIFIDRDDPKSAVESLKDAAETIKTGLSVVIAPEGTRLDTKSVGPFKKGPFRLAMSAGVPIVPIVIRNAEVIAARDSTTLHPGTVDVVVFPPLSLDDWSVDDLTERIAEVRQLYVDTLKDWPVDAVPDHDLYKPRKAPAQKAPAQKAPAQKAPAKTAVAKKAPAKKAPVKKAVAKKAPAKATPEASGAETAPIQHEKPKGRR
jgi:putative phosphoserine phosphatase/1-acylglycerol-3-phosphate O-acyltransferase